MNDSIRIGDWVYHGASGTGGIVRRYCADPRWVWVYLGRGPAGGELPYPASQLTLTAAYRPAVPVSLAVA